MATRLWVKAGFVLLATAGLGAAHPDATLPPPAPAPLSLEAAVDWALRNNPDLAVVRQQHGIAAGAVVIARTYPFNPLAENRVQWSTGPLSAGITNRVPLEQLTLWEVEVRGQGQFRRAEAVAALSRTDWEIARQEQLLAVRVVRAFRTLLYQQGRLRVAEETVRFNQQLADTVRDLFNAGRVGRADLEVAETEVEVSGAVLAGVRTTVAGARYDLVRALGVTEATFEIQGTLETPSPTWDTDALTQAALTLRGDLHAREAAVAEAKNLLRLTIANRYGNPTIGTAYVLDPTRVHEIGGQLNVPLPLFNTHKGEIRSRQAELARTNLEVRQTAVLIRQDVQAALARLETAQNQVEVYRTRVLPRLQSSLEVVQRLFKASQPGVDVLRVLDLQRKLLTGQAEYLGALWELSQAQADLAAAVGEPALGVYPNCLPHTFPLPGCGSGFQS
jgi:outer membrane protein TolC